MNDLNERVLLVDDEPGVLRLYARVLARQGWLVELARTAEEALAILRQRRFAVIVSDIAMPGVDGLSLLHEARAIDRDVPVVLITARSNLDYAVRAVEEGAFRYLQKPVDMRVLEETVHLAMQLHSATRLTREDLAAARLERQRSDDRERLEARFTMATKLLWMAYQPVVSLSGHDVFGYEALLRSQEPSMRSAHEVLDAAERLGLTSDLGRAARACVAADADAATGPAPPTLLVNIHALDLTDEELYEPTSPLARLAPSVVLEITERSPLCCARELAPRVARLRELGFRIAIDDLGAGYAGLAAYSLLAPDIAKIDMSLIRNIECEPRNERVVRSMVELCRDLGTLVIAEGIETVAERDTLAELGCDLFQGFLYARPERGFNQPSWGRDRRSTRPPPSDAPHAPHAPHAPQPY